MVSTCARMVRVVNIQDERGDDQRHDAGGHAVDVAGDDDEDGDGRHGQQRVGDDADHRVDDAAETAGEQAEASARARRR